MVVRAVLLPATLLAQDRQITGRVTRANGGTAVADGGVVIRTTRLYIRAHQCGRTIHVRAAGARACWSGASARAGKFP
jgi:hypothetical protein